MTIATFSQPTNIKNFSVSYDLPTELTTTKLQLGFFDGKDTPSQLVTFYGNFIATPDGMALANGSTATSVDVSILGVEQFKFAALTNNDVVTMQSFVIAKNYVGLLGYLFGSDDQITGSSGDDILSGFTGNDVIDSGSGNDTAVFFGNAANLRLRQLQRMLALKIQSPMKRIH